MHKIFNLVFIVLVFMGSSETFADTTSAVPQPEKSEERVKVFKEQAQLNKCREFSRNLPPVSMETQEALTSLKIPPRKRSLIRLDTDFQMTDERGRILQVDETMEKSVEHVLYENDSVMVKLCDFHLSDRPLVTYSYGPIDLGIYTGPTDDADLLALDEFKFSGDWKNLPVGETVGMAYTLRIARSDTQGELHTLSHQKIRKICNVKAQSDASHIHPKLEGQVKTLMCTWEGEGTQGSGVSTLNYLVDYGVFVISGNTRPGQISVGTVRNVLIEQ